MDRENEQGRVIACGIAVVVVLAALWWLNTHFNAVIVRFDAQQAWLLTAVLMLVFVGLISTAMRGRPTAILIDARNRVSLSRLQALAWTIIVLSAMATLTGWRGFHALQEPLSFNIPNDLLLAMGIVTTSLVGAPILLSLRAAQTSQDPPPPADTGFAADPEGAPAPAPAGSYQAAAVRVAAKTGRASTAARHSGAVIAWSDLECAQWLDLFRGDEVGDGQTIDLAKIQQFLITVVLLATYCGALWVFFGLGANAPNGPLQTAPSNAGDKFQTTLPVLTATFVWLLGISHVGYLVSKAAPTTPKPPPT